MNYIAIWKEKQHAFYYRYYHNENKSIMFDIVFDDGTVDYNKFSSIQDINELVTLREDYKNRNISQVMILTESEDINKFLLAYKLRN